MKSYVIIGNGVAAAGCIEGIRSVDKDTKITVISAENHPVYCRPLISYYLENKTTLDKMSYRDADFYEKNKCNDFVKPIDKIHRMCYYNVRKSANVRIIKLFL